MWTFQDQYTHFQDMSKDENADVLVIAKKNINMGQKILESDLDYPPQEDSRSITTTTSDIYNLPENYIRLIHLYVTISTTRYTAENIFDESTWQLFKRRTSGSSSDYLSHVFIRQRTFEIYPTPSTAGNTMTMIYESLSKDMQYANYTTGTITTLANLGTAVTGSGTTWTSAMIGRYIKINDDGEWYRVTAVGSPTTLTIATPYQGTAIAVGTSAYTIGEIPKTPPATHPLPVSYALWQHFKGVKRDSEKARVWQEEWETGKAWARTTFGNRYTTQVIPNMRNLRRRALLNPNFFPENIT